MCCWRRRGWVLALASLAWAERLHEPVQDFPESCEGGVLEVAGKYRVTSSITFPETCRLSGVKVEVELEAPLNFLGNVDLRGAWEIKGSAPLNKSCVSVAGNLSVHGSAEFRGCQNRNELADGGALLVGGDLILDDATLRFADCRASGVQGAGGAAHVAGWVRQSGGSVRFVRCHASGAGGALAAWGLQQTGGNLTFRNCSSGLDGGGLFVKDGGLLRSGGDLKFFDCTSDRRGGGAALSKVLEHRGGTMAFWHCSSKEEGGGLWIPLGLSWVDGLLLATNCSSNVAGGVSLHGTLHIAGGVLAFSDCRARRAGALMVLHYQQTAGSITAEGCYASEVGAGMAVLQGLLLQEGGSMSFDRCQTAVGGNGGGVYIKPGGLLKLGGSMMFRNCLANDGGGMHVADDVNLDGGTMLFENCSSLNQGGGMTAAKNFRQTAGEATFVGCSTEERGGGLQLKSDISSFELRGGQLTFQRCFARWGGCLSMNGYNGFLQTDGSANFTGCTAESRGGAAIIVGPLVQQGGVLDFRDSKVLGGQVNTGMGGAVYIAGSATQSSGSMFFTNCSVAGNSGVRGGGMYVRHGLNKSSGIMSFEDCASDHMGGAASFGSVSMTGGELNFASSTSANGGCAFVDGAGGWSQSAGSVVFQGCSTKRVVVGASHVNKRSALWRVGAGLSLRDGNMTQSGGILTFVDMEADEGGAIRSMKGDIRFEGGVQIFRNCTAARSGGAIAMRHGNLYHSASDLSFTNCSAGKKGGALCVEEGNFLQEGDAPLTFAECVAGFHGGGAFVGGRLHLQNVTFFDDYAYGSGMGAFVRQETVIQRLRVRGSGHIMVACPVGPINLFHADCSLRKQCLFLGLPAKAEHLLCHAGSGRAWLESEAGCVECPSGMMQLASSVDAPCVQCPPISKQCLSDYLKLFPGYMVMKDDVSRVLHCPNELACPGGDLPQQSVPMCEEGYTGRGCTQCDKPAFGTADEDVLICTQCHSDIWRNSLQIGQLLLQDLLVFGLSAASMLGADPDRRQSSIALNQLLAFHVVSDNVLLSTMRTGTYQQVRSFMPAAVDGFEVVFGLSAGEGLSLECLLRFFGLPMTVFYAHLVDCLVPVVVATLLAVCWDARLALVVACNCFLPRLWGALGKYFVCFRVEPESWGGERICPLWPSWPLSLTSAALLVLSAVALLAVMPHPYLAKGYRARYSYLEVERLLRKMLLCLLASLLPATLSPALHMAGTTLILLAAWVVYLHLAPYSRGFWNITEAALLSTALVMTSLASCLIANDSHWAHSVQTQLILFCAVALLAAVASAGMILLFLMELRLERSASLESATTAKQ